MQALIDYDGWRKWKSYSQKLEGEDGAGKKAKAKKNRSVGPNSSSSEGQ
jgi:osomolarity two-component system response regulator SSK1